MIGGFMNIMQTSPTGAEVLSPYTSIEKKSNAVSGSDQKEEDVKGSDEVASSELQDQEINAIATNTAKIDLKYEKLFSRKTVENIKEWAIRWFEWLSKVFADSFEFMKCSVKCFTDLALFNLIKECNIIKEFNLYLGSAPSPTQPPPIINHYYNVYVVQNPIIVQ
jgi:anti-sigma28 factor (negative regulator of flagellin synthesis)